MQEIIFAMSDNYQQLIDERHCQLSRWVKNKIETMRINYVETVKYSLFYFNDETNS
jgi:hypothetical protein